MMRPTVTSCGSVDIRHLVRRGFFLPRTTLEWIWRTKANGIRGAITLLVLKGGVVFAYTLRPRQDAKRVRELVRVVWTNSVNGGRRPWFQCPCGRRAAILYLARDLPRCRICSGLVYPSQYPQRAWTYGRRHRVVGDTC